MAQSDNHRWRKQISKIEKHTQYQLWRTLGRPIPVVADFWRNKTGGLVVRFSSNQPYVFHFEALLANGKPVPEEELEEFTEYIWAVLYDWGGADDPPDPDARLLT